MIEFMRTTLITIYKWVLIFLATLGLIGCVARTEPRVITVTEFVEVYVPIKCIEKKDIPVLEVYDERAGIALINYKSYTQKLLAIVEACADD